MASTRQRIGLRTIAALGPNAEIWDSAVRGFGARRQRSDAVAYVLLYRTEDGRMRRYTIGRHGAPWTPDMARAEAQRLLGDVKRGADPATARKAKRDAATVATLCDVYLADAEAGRVLIRGGRTKKPRTIAGDRGMIEGHIKPLLGRLPVAAVTRADVEHFMHAVAAGRTRSRPVKTKPHGVSKVRGGRGASSRTMGLLGAIFSYAARHRMRSDNPVRGVERPADGKRDRRLSDDEYATLGEALRSASADIWPPAVACVRFLALTGWRRGEALGLRWGEIDLDRRTAILADTKSGRSMRALSREACDVLSATLKIGDLVFPPTRGDGRMNGFPKQWARLANGKLSRDVTPHVLRHSFASLAGDLGYSEPTIAALVGHKGQTVTSRYVHAADSVLLAAADAVARRTAELMGEARSAEIVQLRPAG